MLPEGWEITPLSNVAKSRIVYGIVQAGPHDPLGVPYLKSSDIGGQIQPEELQKTSIQIHNKYSRSTVTPGDIVISLRGNIGATSIVPQTLPKANLTQGTARIAVWEKYSAEFIKYQIDGETTQRKIQAVAKGSTFVEITLDDLRKIDLSTPKSSNEQRKIAEILSTWDRAIAAQERLIANARTQKKALMQTLLTPKKRLPGFKGEWKTVAIKSMGKISSGGTPDSDNEIYWNGNILWTTPTDITALNKKYITDTKRKISPAGLANCSARLLPVGTLLICTRATIGDMAIATAPISTNQGFKNLTPNSSFVTEFLFHLFAFYKHIFVRYACGSTFLELSKFDFEKREFLVPQQSEQQAIANVLDKADLEIESLEEEIQALRQEKSALMQQLLTGRRRVKIEGSNVLTENSKTTRV